MLVFEERGKPEYPEKNLSKQSREPTNSAHLWRRVRESNPGHIGGRRVIYHCANPAPNLIGCCEKQPIRKLGKRLRSYEKENRSLIPAGDKVPILKIRRCSVYLRDSVLPWWRDKPKIFMLLWEWPGWLKCRATGLETSWLLFFTSKRCSRKRSPNLRPVSPM